MFASTTRVGLIQALGTQGNIMGLFAKISFANALVKLATAFEEMEQSRVDLPVGAGGGLRSLPQHRQLEIGKNYKKWVSALSSEPRHVVTRELLKNAKVSIQLGREARYRGQIALLKHLVSEGVALDVDEFAKSYAD